MKCKGGIIGNKGINKVIIVSVNDINLSPFEAFSEETDKATLANVIRMLSEETKKATDSLKQLAKTVDLLSNQNKSKKLGKGGRARNKSGFKNKFK